MITVRFVETLPPTALFPLGHLEFMERELGLWCMPPALTFLVMQHKPAAHSKGLGGFVPCCLGSTGREGKKTTVLSNFSWWH